MSWTDQNPEATDVLLGAWFLHKGEKVRFEIDRLADGTYRATAGDLFGSQEITRHRDLTRVLYEVQKLND